MINKLDRLIVELRLSPAEAASRLTGIVAHANMIWSAFDSEHFMREADAVLAAEQQQQQQREGGDEARWVCGDGDSPGMAPLLAKLAVALAVVCRTRTQQQEQLNTSATAAYSLESTAAVMCSIHAACVQHYSNRTTQPTSSSKHPCSC
jgi:translation elongation factor EF-G